jgi:hypothetical protein
MPIGMLLYESYDILKGLGTCAYVLAATNLLNFWASPILTGPTVLIPEELEVLVDTFSRWVQVPFPGVLENRRLLRPLRVRLNILLPLNPSRKPFGFARC